MQATTRKPADKNPEATEAARRVLIREGLTTAHDSVGVHLYSSPVATWIEGLPETEAAAQMMRNVGGQWSAKRNAWYLDLRRVQLPTVKTAAVQTVSTTVAAPAARKSTPKPAAKPARKSKSAGKSSKSKAPQFSRSLAPESWGRGFDPFAARDAHKGKPQTVNTPDWPLPADWHTNPGKYAPSKPRPLFKGYKVATVPAHTAYTLTRADVIERDGREPSPWFKD